VKYAPGKRVLVGCRRRGDCLRIEVHDTGRGIPADKLQTIFVEFERLGEGNEQVPGLGLGLSIVERIARTPWRCARNRGAAPVSRSPCRWRSAAPRFKPGPGTMRRAPASLQARRCW